MEKQILQFLANQGASSSLDVQMRLNTSQATVSRLMSNLTDDIVVCGKGKSTKYALAQSIGSYPSQQPIWMIGQDGLPHRLGSLSLLSKSQLYIESDDVNEIFTSSNKQILPWFLSNLKAQGFLGRLLAKKLAPMGVQGNPEAWDIESSLIGALHTQNAPGAIFIGNESSYLTQGANIMLGENPKNELDEITENLSNTVQPGSSAGGEQPKFLASNKQGDSFIVKFSPPLGTPFGDRWSDLLRMECISNDVLNRNNFDVADNQFVQTQKRSYLLSKRFDRTNSGGRLHVISLGAAHCAFVKGYFVNWTSTCNELIRQGRLDKPSFDTNHSIFQFGRLIGNTDMHFGNASLYVNGSTLADILKGQFSLAPVYDMLPMRWRPDTINGASDYSAFDVDFSMANETIRNAAKEFWSEVSTDQFISPKLQAVASIMADLTGGTSRYRQFERNV